jgi:hypothetical protein
MKEEAITNLPNRPAVTDDDTLNQIKPVDVSAVARELDQRTDAGIIVTLLRNAETNRVFVSVVGERHDVSLTFAVPAADAANAFDHPYAYAATGQEDDALAA